MAIKKKSFDLFDYGIDLDSRLMFLGSQKTSISGDESGVDASLADTALKGLHLLNKIAPEGDKPINIMLHNPGGDYHSGMAIYGGIKRSKNPVHIEVIGLAASMATVILQAAHRRLMDRHARLLIHWGSDGYYGHSKVFETFAEQSKQLNAEMVDIYMTRIREKNPDFKVSTLKEMLNFDCWLNAQQSLDLGLVDEIL